MEYNENIRKIRKLKRMSQLDLAGRLAVTVPYVCKLERGKTNPSVKVLKKVARALQVDIKDFFA